MQPQYNTRQLLSLGAVLALTPALRLFPAQAALLAGRAAWLVGIAALPLAVGWAWAMARFLEAMQPGEELPDLLLRLGGKSFGRPALAVLVLWCFVYAGFVLRSGADRLVGTIYPGASPLLFSQLMGLVALAASLSGPRSLVRMGRMILPLLAGVLLALLLCAFSSLDVDNLLPLGPADLLPLLRTTPITLDIAAGAGTALCFLVGGLRDRSRLFPALGFWVAGLCVLLTVICAAVTGAFGAPLTARLARPFFVLVRTLTFFHTLERVEALVVMLWIFPDFLITALFLWAGQYGLRLLCGYRPDTRLHPRLDMGEGRYLAWVYGAGATLLSLLLAREPAALELWSTVLIPAANLSFVFVFLPLLYIIGRRSPDSAVIPPRKDRSS